MISCKPQLFSLLAILYFVPAIFSLVLADNPPGSGKGPDSVKTKLQDEAARARAEQARRAADILAKEEAELAELRRFSAKAAAELTKAVEEQGKVEAAEQAAAEAILSKLGPAERAKLEAELDPEATAAQYELVEDHLKSHPQLLDQVEKAYRDEKLTLIEFEVIQALRDAIVKRDVKARTKAKIQELRSRGK